MSSSLKNNQKVFGTAIVGAGIHGLHILTRLVDEGIVAPDEILLIDPHDEPAGQWRGRTAGCGMRYLRSPGSHGVTRDFRTVRRAAADRSEEFIPPYHRPSTNLFAHHIDEAWRPSSHRVTMVRGRARKVTPHEGKKGFGEHSRLYAIESETVDGVRHHRARTVILAPGQPEPALPPVLASLPRSAPVFHVYHPGFRPEMIARGTRVAVVGGGIAAAHLLLDCRPRGVAIDFWNRDRPTAWQFDSDPCFIGPRCGSLFGAISSPADRRSLIGRARRRGSLPPDLYRSLSQLVGYGRIARLRAAVSAATVAGRRVVLAGSDSGRPVSGEYDLVVSCTGFAAAPPAQPIVDTLAREAGLPLHEGYPLPEEDLSWAPGLYVTGALGELVIGPPARNIIGAHLSARRIVPSLARYVSFGDTFTQHAVPATQREPHRSQS
jgi:hypothetical protein